MRTVLLALAAFAALAHSASAAEPPPTVTEVRAFMARVEDASRARDLERITAVLAADCRIELTATIEGHEQVTLLTRAEYVEMLANGFAALKDLEEYHYSVTGLTIALDSEPPGATVVSQVHESFVHGGRPFATESEETARVERRAGELKFVAVSSKTVGR